MVDDAGEEEWKVEEICHDRKQDGGGLEFLVKWKSGDETWEPYENVAETEALDKYEVTVNSPYKDRLVRTTFKCLCVVYKHI